MQAPKLPAPDAGGRPCPRCGRLSDRAFIPFCSDRCRLLDLAAWLEEAYTIPARETDDGEPEGTR